MPPTDVDTTDDAKVRIQPPGAFDASAAGYSHGILVGQHLSVAGQVSFADGIEAQAEEAFASVAAVLAEAGGTMRDLVSIRVYTTEQDCWERIREAREKYLPAPFPAATMVIVVGLAHPSLKLEVEATAVVGSGGAST